MITKEMLMRAYALMECERAGGQAAGSVVKYFLQLGLITSIEAGWFLVAGENETGPRKTEYMHLEFGYRCQSDPVPAGKQWSKSVMLGVPELEERT